jgi:hypothetical protein
MATIIPKIKGIVTNGKLIIDYNNTIKQEKWVRTLEGKRVEVIIKAERHSRSIPQNSYYWGVVLLLISKETGYTPEELHEFFKRIYLKKEIIIGGQVYEVSISTKKLNTEQFMDYIEKIKGFVLAKLNLAIPNPDEYDFDAFIVDEDSKL